MSALETFQQLAGKATDTRLRGAWLVSMLLSQGQALRMAEVKIAAPGLEHLARALALASDGHESVANLIPVARRDKVTGSANAELLLAYAETLGLSLTDPEIDGLLATAMRNLLVSQALVRIVQGHGVFTHEFEPAIDQCAALTSALHRAEREIRAFAQDATPAAEDPASLRK